MADPKTSCPHCGGHIQYPKDAAGRSVACPHCNVAFILPAPKSVVPMAVMTLLAIAVVSMGALLVLQLQRKNHAPATRQPAMAVAAPAPQPAVFVPQTPDDQDIARLCKQYSDAQSSKDTNGVYALFCSFVKTNLTLQNLVIDGAIYDFQNLESVRYRNGALGKSAQARVKRKAQNTPGGPQESVRELEFVKETDQWKLFPVLELARKIVGECGPDGLTEPLKNDLQLLRAGDAFNAWDANDTNAFAEAFKLAQHRNGIFPWEMDFTITSNRLDNLIFVVSYRLQNRSAAAWNAPLLEFQLQATNQSILSADDILPNVPAGEAVERNLSFLLKNAPAQTTQFHLDVSYPLGGQRRLPLLRNVPLELKVQSVSEIAKFDVLGTQFESVTNDEGEKIQAARVDFRVENTGTEPIQNLAVQCYWYTPTGEPVDKTTEYVVGTGDAPLAVGQSRTGFVRCGKGDNTAHTPVKADIYLESGDRRAPAQKELIIQ